MVALFFEDQHGRELISSDVRQTQMEAALERGSQVHRPAQKYAGLRVLRHFKLVEWTGVTPPAVVRSIRAYPGIAKLLAAERPVD